MARCKLKDSVWFIAGEALKIYISNFFKFTGYMCYPILGQLFGFAWAIATTFFITDNYEYLTAKFPTMGEYSSFLAIVLLAALPGMLIMLAAFWQFLIAYGALNSMTEGVLTTGHVYDFNSHKEVVKRKIGNFIVLWFVYSLFIIFSIIPFFWIIGGIFFVYFILIFQIFTFTEEMPVATYFRRSFELIKGNFAKTIALILILVIICFYAIPAGLNVIIDILNIRNFLTNAIIPVIENYQLDSYNSILQALNTQGITPEFIAKSIIEQLVFFIAIGFTLPLRSICWTLWYKVTSEKIEKKTSKKSGK